MDSPEYPQLRVLSEVIEQLVVLDDYFGEGKFLEGIFDLYVGYFREVSGNNPNEGILYRPEDTGWGPDISDPNIVTVAGYFSYKGVDELRLTFLDANGYLDYIDQVESYNNGNSQRLIPEFVFKTFNGALYMNFGLRDIDNRRKFIPLISIESGKAQPKDPSVKNLLPFVQQIWDFGSDSFARAAFSNN